MRTRLPSWVWIALLLSCGSDLGGRSSGSPPPPPAGPDPFTPKSNLPCDVDNVFRTRCQTCHSASPTSGATIPLVTHDDLVADQGGKKVYELVAEQIHDAARGMPPPPGKLTAEELATLDAWIQSGAPTSTETCELAARPSGVAPLNCQPDLILKSSKAFTMPAGATDLYMCFGATVKVDKKRHVTAFAPHVDNKNVVHHILLFKSPTAVSSEPFPCSGVGSAVWQLVSGWAPGGTNLELPPEAGFPEETGDTHWVLQVHYNNASGQFAGSEDQSGYELCTTDALRTHDAGVAAFGTILISVPPRSNFTLTCSFPTGGQWAGKKIFNSFPHMHGLGAALSTERIPAKGGSPQVIASRDNYDFNYQANETTTSEIEQGDVLRTRCSWKNPSDETVTFGEKTSQEMCFNFLSFYPAIPGLPWVTPSLSPACVPESKAIE